MISAVQTVVHRALVNGFQSALFYSVVEDAVQKSVVESQSVDTVLKKLVDALCFNVPIARCLKREVENTPSMTPRLRNES